MDNELDINIVKESLKCEICDKTFNTLQGLRSHKTKMHKGDRLEKNTVANAMIVMISLRLKENIN